MWCKIDNTIGWAVYDVFYRVRQESLSQSVNFCLGLRFKSRKTRWVGPENHIFWSAPGPFTDLILVLCKEVFTWADYKALLQQKTSLAKVPEIKSKSGWSSAKLGCPTPFQVILEAFAWGWQINRGPAGDWYTCVTATRDYREACDTQNSTGGLPLPPGWSATVWDVSVYVGPCL